MNFAVGKVSELRRALTLPPQMESESIFCIGFK